MEQNYPAQHDALTAPVDSLISTAFSWQEQVEAVFRRTRGRYVASRAHDSRDEAGITQTAGGAARA